jgi:hypothetical protein
MIQPLDLWPLKKKPQLFEKYHLIIKTNSFSIFNFTNIKKRCKSKFLKNIQLKIKIIRDDIEKTVTA